MQRIGKRLISMVMAATLCVTLITPMGSGQVYATENTTPVQSEEGTTSGEGEQKVQYKLVFQENDNNIDSLTIAQGKELKLAGYVKLQKEDGSAADMKLEDGTLAYSVAPDNNILAVAEDGTVTVKDSAKAKDEATVTVTWTSNADPSVKAEGSIKITVESSETPSEKKIEIVEDNKVIKEKTIALRDTYDLSKYIVVSPEDGNKEFTYTVETISDNKDVDVVSKDDKGMITAKNIGDAKVTITNKDGASGEITIHVVDVPVDLELEQSHSMKVAETYEIKAKLVWASGKKDELKADALKYILEKDSDKVVSVDENGKVTSLKQTTYPATAQIKVSYTASYKVGEESKEKNWEKICTITVEKSPITGIKIDTTKMPKGNWKINDTYQLQLNLTPEGASAEDVQYKTSDKDVATVSKTGEIKTTGIGKVTITAYAKDNKNIKDTVEINVYQTVFNVAELGVNGTDAKDDADALNKILKYATNVNEMITVVVPDGTYYLGSALKVWTETNIQLSANAVMKRMPSAEGKSMIVNRTSKNNGGYTAAHDIIISGGVWDGNTTGSDHSNLLYFGHAKNITIRNTTIRNDSGAHLIEFTGVQNALVENVTLTGFVMSKNLSASQNAEKEAIQIDHCTGETNAPGMEPFDGTACDGVTIRNCNISNYMAGIGTHTQGANPSNNVLIENNVFSNIANACINLPNIQNVTIRNNTASNFTTFLYASGSQGVVENNSINNGEWFVPVTSSGLRAKNGITVSNGSNFVIRNNTIENAQSNGITVWNKSTAEITGNKIRKNQLYGVRTQGSTVTFKKNKVKKNEEGAFDTYKDAKITSSDDIRSYYINIKKSYKYKGKAVKPKIKIKGLKKKYYKVTYKNNKKPGTATVIIKGKKGVKQTLKIKFKIKKK